MKTEAITYLTQRSDLVSVLENSSFRAIWVWIETVGFVEVNQADFVGELKNTEVKHLGRIKVMTGGPGALFVRFQA